MIAQVICVTCRPDPKDLFPPYRLMKGPQFQETCVNKVVGPEERKDLSFNLHSEDSPQRIRPPDHWEYLFWKRRNELLLYLGVVSAAGVTITSNN